MGTKAAKPIPEGYSSITPYLTIKGAAKAIEYYKKAFGATERGVLTLPNGLIGHAEVRIGDSLIMLADEFPGMDCTGPEKLGGTPVTLHLYVDNVDKVVEQAVNAGGTLKRAVKDQFYGDRTGGVTDPFGHEWYIATRVEDLSSEEVERRSAEAMKDREQDPEVKSA